MSPLSGSGWTLKAGGLCCEVEYECVILGGVVVTISALSALLSARSIELFVNLSPVGSRTKLYDTARLLQELAFEPFIVCSDQVIR